MIEATATSVRDTGSHVEVTAGSSELQGAEFRRRRRFQQLIHLLPRPVDIQVMAATVAFYELGEREMAVFGGMPSTIVFGDREEIIIFCRCAYPDGKTYLKLGGDTEGPVSDSWKMPARGSGRRQCPSAIIWRVSPCS